MRSVVMESVQPLMAKADDIRALGQRIRERRLALELSGAELALRSGFDRSYINTLENARRGSYPKRLTIEKIAHALRTTPDALEGRSPFEVSTTPYDTNRHIRAIADTLSSRPNAAEHLAAAVAELIRAVPGRVDARESPNAIRITLADDEGPPGRVQKRGATVAPFDPERLRPRRRAAATPDAELFDPGEEPPLREIPTHYWEMGARHPYKAEGDSMIDFGITDRDLIFVRPYSDVKSAVGHVVIAEVFGREYVKKLTFEGERIVLVSGNRKYKPWTLTDAEMESFRLAGVAVGRSGYIAV